MSADISDKRLGELRARMRADWDRRIAHDYRYWMGDGIADDQAMWDSGERDFEALTAGVNFSKADTEVALELGCGVGRLLRASAGRFKKVIGVDVSAEALSQACVLLKDFSNIELSQGNGTTLEQIPSESIDFVYSFAVLGNMPVQAFAQYLIEVSRVLKIGAEARLQLYLGASQETVEDDTLAIRGFEHGRFVAAAVGAGFEVQNVNELVLPFDVSDRERGLIASIVSLRKISEPQQSTDELYSMLIAQEELVADSKWSGSRTEYLMALACAQKHMDHGRVLDAKEAVRFAVDNYGAVEQEVHELLVKLEQLGKEKSSGNGARELSGVIGLDGQKSELLERNYRVLQDCFPELHQSLLSQGSTTSKVELRKAENGEPLLFYNGVPLDQPSKPGRAGEVWSERTLVGLSKKDSTDVVVVGFAGGYHLEALGRLTDKKLHVVEPSIEVLNAIFSVRDCERILTNVADISESIEIFRKNVLPTLDVNRTELVFHPQTKLVAGTFCDELRRMFVSARGFTKIRPRIGVVGPIYGGSLPISWYTSDALRGMNQRVQPFELSGFHDAYRGIRGFVQGEGRVRLLESQYVEMLSRMVLEAINEQPVDILLCLAQAPLSAEVLSEIRNRGIITAMWFVEDCRRMTAWQYIAQYYDYFFLIQREPFLKLVEQAGAGRAAYVPVACSPQVHVPQTLYAEEIDRWGSEISFVGAGYHNRKQMFAGLANRDFKIWGTEWPEMYPFSKLVQEEGRRIPPEEYVKIFNASKINLNLHSSMERDGVEPFGDFVNPRTFELAATGAFQLVDNRALLAENFELGTEVVTFLDRKEMFEKIDYYLAHPEQRQLVTEAARSRALQDHTYQQRVETMLEYIYVDHYDQLLAKDAQGPWPRTFKALESFPELAGRFQAVFDRGGDPSLDNLVADIQIGKGVLSEEDKKILFLHHVKKQIVDVRDARDGKKA